MMSTAPRQFAGRARRAALTHPEAKATIALATSRRIVLRNRTALMRLDA
jgi:hypothetical protein